MDDQNNLKVRKLLDLMQKTGYPIAQNNGQRRFGPPPDWNGEPPPRGCEVFVGKLPRDIYEDELVPLFSRVGKIYEMRLMMDFSGSNRGYAFVMYATQAEAAKAVKELNGFEIKPRRHIGVVKSVDNCRLYIGDLPRNMTKEDLKHELSKIVTGVVQVVMSKHCYDSEVNRGFAFVEFTSHKAAAMARRELIPGCIKLRGQFIKVDWAEPEPQVDEEVMKTVKVLFVRNFALCTHPETIKQKFEDAINNKVERVKKMYDYAFVHFYERAHAEMALAKLQNAEIDGRNIEICWSKPVDRELYRMQKLYRGNAKFNIKTFDLAQTLFLYKQHLEQKEYANSCPKDEGIGSAYAGDSPSISPMEFKPYHTSLTPQSSYVWPPAKLESMCKRFLWSQPVYSYQKYIDPTGREFWVCSVELPQVGLPLLTTLTRIGPLVGSACPSMSQACAAAAELALQTIKMTRVDLVQPPASPAYSQIPPAQIPPAQNYMRLPYDYTPMFPQTQQIMPITIPTVWRTA